MKYSKSILVVSFSPALDSVINLREPLRAGKVHRVDQEVVTFGGKALNVAKVLKANRVNVTVAGIIGEDYHDAFYSYLKHQKIPAKFLKVPYPTRKNIMIKDKAGREFKINYPAFPALKLSFKKIKDFIKPMAIKHSMIILNGSLPSAMDTKTYANLVNFLKKQQKIVVVDTSGKPLEFAVSSMPDIIKPNKEEFAEICAKKLNNQKALVKAIQKFSFMIKVVIVSDGKKGAFFGNHGSVWHAVPPTVEAKDSTGSGDYLLGQFCADFLKHNCQLTEDMMVRAVAAGAACAEVEATPFIKKERILKLAKKAYVKRII